MAANNKRVTQQIPASACNSTDKDLMRDVLLHELCCVCPVDKCLPFQVRMLANQPFQVSMLANQLTSKQRFQAYKVYTDVMQTC